MKTLEQVGIYFATFLIKILKQIGIFFATFLLYHISLSSFFPADENNVLIAPAWYVPLGMIISVVAAVLLTKKKKPSMKKNPDSVINYVKGTDEDIPIEPVINHHPQMVHTPTASEPPVSNAHASIEAELFCIDCMEGHDFEYWCAQLLTDCGFSKVVVTQGSGDQGVDIIAEKDGIRYAIQCKCYSKDLGNSPVQEVTAGKSMPQYHCQIGAVMTNRHFTKGAKDLADATGTLLWDRDWIENKLATVRKLSRTGCQPSITYSGLAPDALFSLAVEVILDTDQASVSMLQRRLKLDYERAARLMDRLEEKGIVGPYREGRLREILITKAQWETMK